jgi:hypothetical protein
MWLLRLKNVVTFGGCIGKYNMSKFLALCEKVERLLKEEETGAVLPTDSTQQPTLDATGGAPTTDGGTQIDPSVNSGIKPATPEQMTTMIVNLADYISEKLGQNDPLSEKLKSLSNKSYSSDNEKASAIVALLAPQVDPEADNTEDLVHNSDIASDEQPEMGGSTST